ncbi:MAG: hypothetical protein KC503_47035 [Myxococcales bacterium]|nr:hypothetical protein [Myxococcales bacterium]
MPFDRRQIAVLLLLVACAAAGCAARGSERGIARDPRCHAPAGSPAQMTRRAGPFSLYGYALQLSAPRRCGEGVAFDVAGSGRRRFAGAQPAGRPRLFDWRRSCRGRAPLPPPCASACRGRPRPDEACTDVSALELAYEVRRRLQASGRRSSVGIAACGERHGERGFYRVTLSVYDWADADAAIAAAAERLRAWRVGDALRVAVQPIACGVAL